MIWMVSGISKTGLSLSLMGAIMPEGQFMLIWEIHTLETCWLTDYITLSFGDATDCMNSVPVGWVTQVVNTELVHRLRVDSHNQRVGPIKIRLHVFNHAGVSIPQLLIFIAYFHRLKGPQKFGTEQLDVENIED